MRPVRVVIGLLFVLLLAEPARAAGPLQQSTNCSSSTCGTTTFTCTLPNPVIAGDTLVLTFGNVTLTSNQTVSSISGDTCGNTWPGAPLKAATQGASFSKDAASIWGVLNAAGGCAPTITINLSGGGTSCNNSAVLSEFPKATATDQTQSSSSGSSTSPFLSGTTPTTSQASEFMIAVAGYSGGLTLSSGPTNGFAEFTDPSAHSTFSAWNQVSNGPGTYSTAWTPSASNTYAAVVVTFKLPPTVIVSASFGNGGTISAARAVNVARADSIGNGGTIVGASSVKIARADSIGNGGIISGARGVQVARADSIGNSGSVAASHAVMVGRAASFGNGGIIAAGRTVVLFVAHAISTTGSIIARLLSIAPIARQPPVIAIVPISGIAMSDAQGRATVVQIEPVSTTGLASIPVGWW